MVGAIYVAVGSFDIGFYIAGAIFVAASLCSFAAQAIHRRKKLRMENENNPVQQKFQNQLFYWSNFFHYSANSLSFYLIHPKFSFVCSIVCHYQLRTHRFKQYKNTLVTYLHSTHIKNSYLFREKQRSRYFRVLDLDSESLVSTSYKWVPLQINLNSKPKAKIKAFG